jgi:hypothetical protein
MPNPCRQANGGKRIIGDIHHHQDRKPEGPDPKTLIVKRAPCGEKVENEYFYGPKISRDDPDKDQDPSDDFYEIAGKFVHLPLFTFFR